MMRLSTVILGAALMVGATSQKYQPQAGRQRTDTITVFRDVTVLPMDSERVLSHRDVVIRGDRIVEVNQAAAAAPARAAVIDGSGKFPMPGPADMPPHLPTRPTADHR